MHQWVSCYRNNIDIVVFYIQNASVGCHVIEIILILLYSGCVSGYHVMEIILEYVEFAVVMML